MRKALIATALIVFAAISMYRYVPAFRHAVYYRYFVFMHPDVVGGPCGPNCDGYKEFAANKISHTDTLPDFLKNEAGRIKVSGTIYNYKGDPAAEILIYVFQANASGIYPKKGNETGAAKLNGYLRAWMKTDEKGRYTFYTNRPGAYPATKRMAHIHCVIKEPDLNAYTLPDFVFPDDPNLTARAAKTTQEENGGLLIEVGEKDGIIHYQRNMYLGRNVVNHPAKK